MPATDMTAWSRQVIQRLKALLNVIEITEETGEAGSDGDSDAAKLRRAAIARNRNPGYARTAHEALTVLAFDGYQDWCDFDDDEWTKNCLSQVINDDQSRYLIPVLELANLIDLSAAVEKLAGEYRAAWQQAAEAEAAQAVKAGAEVTAAGLVPAQNTESWKYSRTPGTKYYIFNGGKYLYSDDKNAALSGWATAEVRDKEAASRATEWETGSGVFYTSYANPAHVDGVTYVFGGSKDGPWVMTREQAEVKLTASRKSSAGGAAAAGDPIGPYFDTGYFTKFHDGAYTFGETRDAATWYPTYQGLLDAIAARDLEEEVDELIREAEDTSDEAYQLAVSVLGEDEVRRLATEIARLP